jgi:hypothetical protein
MMQSRKLFFTPKGLDLKAQGCRAAATLGNGSQSSSTPKGLHHGRTFRVIQPLRGRICASRILSQGSRVAATLGFGIKPLRGRQPLQSLCPTLLGAAPWEGMTKEGHEPRRCRRVLRGRPWAACELSPGGADENSPGQRPGKGRPNKAASPGGAKEALLRLRRMERSPR